MDSRNFLRPLQRPHGFGRILEAADELDACRSRVRLINVLVGLTVPQPTGLEREEHVLGKNAMQLDAILDQRDSHDSDDDCSE